MMKYFLPIVLFSLFLACPLWGQAEQSRPMGILVGATDIGNVQGFAGSVQFDVVAETYTLKGSGANVWGKEDAFFFVYVPVEGNFEMSSFLTLFNEGKNDHRKAGIMFRETLDADSACVFITVHGEGLTSLQYREKKADTMAEDAYEVKETAPKFVSLGREGGRFIVQVDKEKLDTATAKTKEITLDKKGYLGIFVCSHSNNDFERASFRSLQFKRMKK